MAMLKTADTKGLAPAARAKPTVIIPFTPTMPDVNLLPPRVFDAVSAKKAQRKLAVAGGVLALLVVVTWAAQAAQIMVANSAREKESAKSAGLEEQVRTLGPVKVFYAGVAAQKVSVQKTMALELYFSQVADDLVKAAPPGIGIETVTVAAGAQAGQSSTTGAACPAPDPFKPLAIVTCVQFTGTATTRANVSAFLVNLSKNTKFANVYIPVTDSAGGKEVTFNGSVGVTEKFFTNRYSDDVYLLKGLGVKP